MGNAPDHRHKRSGWVSAWLPVFICTILIAITSSNNFSSDQTSAPFRWIYEAIFGHVPDAHWHIIHFFIRKGIHFFGYGVYGLLWLRAWWLTLPNSHYAQNSTLAVLGCAIVASADEFHQSFLSHRTGSPRDVLLDCCGSLALLLISYLVLLVFRPERLHHSP